jgi:hypothetical protein
MKTITPVLAEKIHTYEIDIRDLFTNYCTYLGESIADLGEESEMGVRHFTKGIEAFHVAGDDDREQNIRQLFKDGDTMFLVGGEGMKILEAHVANNELFRIRVNYPNNRRTSFYVNHEDIEW